MGVVVLSNPRSGVGRSRVLAEHLAGAIARAGHGVKVLLVGGDETLDPEKLARARALVVVGGDGTVLRCAEAAARAECPIYHVPAGNENLFGRSFGMKRDPAAVLRALEAGAVGRVDLGRVESGGSVEPFLLMCSLGPDSGVIRRLARSRRRALGHAAYIAPVLAECLRPLLPRIWIEVEGQPVVDGLRGWAIVANCREYAARVNPVRDAVMDDGLLNAVFMPATTTIGAVMWMLRCARRADLRGLGASAVRGKTIRVAAESDHAPLCYQVDGESSPACGVERLEFTATLLPRHVPVLGVR